MRYFLILALALAPSVNAQKVLQSGSPMLRVVTSPTLAPLAKDKDSIYTDEVTAKTPSEAGTLAVKSVFARVFRIADQVMTRCNAIAPNRDFPNFGSISKTEAKNKKGYTVQATLTMSRRAFETMLEDAISEQAIIRQESVRACVRELFPE